MKTSEDAHGRLAYVSGMGMVSALGLDVATSCAASRAGLSRARPFEGYMVPPAKRGEDEGVTAHSLPLATEGFEGPVRLLQLATLALRDLLQRHPWVREATGVAAYLSLPDPARGKPAPSTAPVMEEGEPPPPAPVPPWELAQWLWSTAAASAGWGAPPTMRHLVSEGHTGVTRALQQACADLASGVVDLAIVGGVDSLLDEETLAWLDAAGRLKKPDMPAGLQPGEAAAFLVLEREQSAFARPTGPSLVLRGLAFGREQHLVGADDPPSGRGLAAPLHELVEYVRFQHQLPLWCILDLNGEPYRSMDWGGALVHIESVRKLRVLGETTYPAASFGDTGAASGGVGLCLAATAFQRSYAPGLLGAVVSASDSGDRSVLLCQAA